MVNRLIEIIGREARLFESFLELLERQQASLVANDVDELNRVTADMRHKLVESRLLSRQREELVDEIREANAIEGDLCVTRLLDLVGEEQANQLARLRGLILSLNDKITEVRNQNATLLNRSRDYIVKMMEMLSRINNPQDTYVATGLMGSGDGAMAVDRRA